MHVFCHMHVENLLKGPLETNKFFLFRDLLNFRRKCIGVQIRAFNFLFCIASDAKCAKSGEH